MNVIFNYHVITNEMNPAIEIDTHCIQGATVLLGVAESGNGGG